MPKTQSRTVTAEMRANAVRNAKRYKWAREEQRQAIKAAAPWLKVPDRELWMMVTPQTLPRTIHTTQIRYTDRDAVCPNCRDGIVPYGNYPWKIDVLKRPWKLECPNCGEIYPKNDFQAYYRSALDEHGIFQPGKGDPELLFNAEHPNPRDPLHKFAVDDGYGWHHPEDGRYGFIAYYNSWGQWRALLNALVVLSQAYTVTDDRQYARKAGVLFDRIADVYPAMDLYPYIMEMGFEHSEGGTGQGRVEGCIWEAGRATSMALAYDRIFDGMANDAELVEFLGGMADEFKLGRKARLADIQRNIERNLLLEFAKSVRDGRIGGNEGMYQKTMAATAIALDSQPKTTELLDWVFRPGRRRRRKDGTRPINGGNVPFILNNTIGRDGMGTEGAPGYSLWAHTMLEMAELLEAYPDYTRHSIFHDFPKYRQAFITPVLWQCLGQATPPIGDSGTFGAWGQTGTQLSTLASGFRVYGDPRIAKCMMDLSRERRQLIRGSIFDARPGEFAERVRKAAAKVEKTLPAVNLNGYGLAIMQTPKARDGRALWLYYGRNTGHGHKDRLNLGLYAENIDMLPDLGYPEYASGRPKDSLWTKNSISHNVVIVDEKVQEGSYTGHLLLFDPSGLARVVHAASDGIYKGMTTYRRLSALIDASSRCGYVADFFWVRGGRTHRQFWHGPGGKMSADGLRLVEQPIGSFAGEDVAPGIPPENLSGCNGYMYLHGVRRDAAPPAQFVLDYDAEDLRSRIAKGRDPHLRLTCLTPTSEVAIALGDPPKNREGNPEHIDCAILTRTGRRLESAFVTIVEPYDCKPVICSARRLAVETADPGILAAAVELHLSSGRTDTIIAAEGATRVEAENGVVLDGVFGLIARGCTHCSGGENGRLASRIRARGRDTTHFAKIVNIYLLPKALRIPSFGRRIHGFEGKLE